MIGSAPNDRERLRILLLIDLPLDRRLGAARMYVDFADEFRALGHHVDVFCLTDAYASPALIPRLAGVTRSYQRRAARFIREHGSRYDVIDARHPVVISHKHALRFGGLLVARSVGLLPVYEDAFLNADRGTPQSRGKLLLRPLLAFELARERRRSRLAIEHADLINVLNADEEALCAGVGAAEKTVVLPLGLSGARLKGLGAARLPAIERRAVPKVVFIGTWCRRKGAHDVGPIIRQVLACLPTARFLLLGTAASGEARGGSRAAILRDLELSGECVEVVPRFEPDQLPRFLSAATVGMLPSYADGFPYALIEMLAGGLPIVAYNSPGPRGILPDVDAGLLVTSGDISGFATKLVEILSLTNDMYQTMCDRALKLADTLHLEAIASETLTIYRRRLAEIRASAAESGQ